MRFEITSYATNELRSLNHIGLLRSLPRILAFKLPYYMPQGGFATRKGARRLVLEFLLVIGFASVFLIICWPVPAIVAALFFVAVSTMVLASSGGWTLILAVLSFMRKWDYLVWIYSGKHWRWALRHELMHIVQYETRLRLLVHMQETEHTLSKREADVKFWRGE